MYKKNMSLAFLELAFAVPPAAISGDSPSRPDAIGLYLKIWFEKASAFDDIKDFVAQMDFEEIQLLLRETLPKLLSLEVQSAPCSPFPNMLTTSRAARTRSLSRA